MIRLFKNKIELLISNKDLTRAKLRSKLYAKKIYRATIE